MTSHTHYENYRTGKLTAMMKNGEVIDVHYFVNLAFFRDLNAICNPPFLECFPSQEEGNALTAVGDEIRSRSAAAKKEGKWETHVDKKVQKKKEHEM